jgi:hypothetical protein
MTVHVMQTTRTTMMTTRTTMMTTTTMTNSTTMRLVEGSPAEGKVAVMAMDFSFAALGEV